MQTSPPTDPEQPIFLIGFPGTGKSTTGLLVAAKLERPFVDLDAVIEAEAHMTIPEIFFNERESGFRLRESAALRQVAGPKVVAVGGGAPAHGDNLDFMLQTGTVVCLTAPVEELVRRLGGAESRPLLSGRSVQEEIERLLPVRQPFYARAAFTVDTGGLVPSQVARRIVEVLRLS